MKNIASFFDRFKELAPPNDSVKSAVVDAVYEVVGARLDKKSISIFRGVAHVRAPSVLKNTIALNRGKVLERIYSDVPKARDTLRDVR